MLGAGFLPLKRTKREKRRAKVREAPFIYNRSRPNTDVFLFSLFADLRADNARFLIKQNEK